VRITPDWNAQAPAARRIYGRVPLPPEDPPVMGLESSFIDQRKALSANLNRLRFLVLVQRELDRIDSGLFLHPAGTHRQYVEECVADYLLQRRSEGSVSVRANGAELFTGETR